MDLSKSNELDGDVIRINAEEAWGATDFRHILGKLMPELTITISLRKQGVTCSQQNDIDGKYFPERYLVDAYVKDADFYEYFVNKRKNEGFCFFSDW